VTVDIRSRSSPPSRRATINESSFKQRRTTNSAAQDLNSETTFAKQKPTTMTRRLSDYDQLHLKKEATKKKLASTDELKSSED
jgi:hypothetical protein